MGAERDHRTLSPAELAWTDQGAPRSRRFDDVYFSGDGLAESRAVFLAGCGLPQAWAGRRRFTVAELGFGTGLNILALLDLWRSTRPVEGRLHVFSIEAFPMSRAEAARALAPFAEVADLSERLLAQWPAIRRGWVRLDLPELNAMIDLAVDEAGAALAGWDGRADAWFLDGFAPSRNPEMWRAEVLDLVAARSAPGAGLATFTVAGAVRRSLAERGFTVERAAGHGRKRERLEARLPGGPPPERQAPRVAVVGGGIAGASLARAFARLGASVSVFDPTPGGGASGAPAVLVSPRLDVGGGPTARLYAQAFARAVALYRSEAPSAVISEGALRLGARPNATERFARLSESELYRAGSLEALAADAAATLLGDRGVEALRMADALTLEPGAVLDAWLPPVASARVGALSEHDGVWRLLEDDGTVAAEAEIVCLAAGPATASLANVELEPVRGQLSWSARLDAPPSAASWGGYAAPTREGGVLFGATHQRGRSDSAATADDETTNLRGLAERRPRLAQAAAAAGPLQSRAAVRAATPDRSPLAGELRPGLFVLSGLGGRGFTTAPLLAEHVAALALGVASPLARDLGELIDPHRFQARAARRRVKPAKAELQS